MGIDYCKIRVPGHQDVPEKCCQKFFRVVNSFLKDNRNNGKKFNSKSSSKPFLFRQTYRHSLYSWN